MCFDVYPDHEWIKTIPNASYVDMDTLLRYKSSVYLKLKWAPDQLNSLFIIYTNVFQCKIHTNIHSPGVPTSSLFTCRCCHRWEVFSWCLVKSMHHHDCCNFQTHHLINEEAFAKMKDDVVLVNTRWTTSWSKNKRRQTWNKLDVRKSSHIPSPAEARSSIFHLWSRRWKKRRCGAWPLMSLRAKRSKTIFYCYQWRQCNMISCHLKESSNIIR